MHKLNLILRIVVHIEFKRVFVKYNANNTHSFIDMDMQRNSISIDKSNTKDNVQNVYWAIPVDIFELFLKRNILLWYNRAVPSIHLNSIFFN